MLFYRSVMMAIMTDQVEPLLKSAVQEALTQAIGPDWYQREGRAVMQHYADFNKLQKRIDQNMDPLDVMDLTALLFLLLPYSENPAIVFDEKLLQRVAEHFAMTQDFCREKLLRLRQIRNHIMHDNCEGKEIPDAAYLENGLQEKKWLDEVEVIMRHFQSAFQLENYRVQLNRLIGQRNKVPQNIPAYTALIAEAESTRREFGRIYHLDFLKAPLVPPLSGAAPWAESLSDLETLPWPSLQNAPAQAPAAPAGARNGPAGAPTGPAGAPTGGTSATWGNLNDILNESAADLAKRAGDGLNRFLRFLDK